MRSVARMVSIFFLFAFLTGRPMAAQDLDAVVNKTLKRYEKLNSFYTKFTQTLCDEAAGMCRIFDGEVYFLKPNYFRMEIENPAQTYVGDSVSLWIYFPDKKRAVRQNLGQIPFAINPDMFLKNYEEHFNAQLSTAENEFEITLTPKEETEIYQKIVVAISKRKFEIVGISIIDEAGVENRFTFDNIQLNKKISKDIFKFNPPEGTEIIE